MLRSFCIRLSNWRNRANYYLLFQHLARKIFWEVILFQTPMTRTQIVGCDLDIDPVNQTTISIINTASNPITPNLVRFESIRCIGSVSGTDKIQADYRIYSTTDFRLVIPSNCRLIDVHRNGVSIEAGISEARNSPSCHLRRRSYSLELLERRVRANWLTRSCEMPEFKLVDAVVLSSQYDFVPMPDMLPSSILGQRKSYLICPR